MRMYIHLHMHICMHMHMHAYIPDLGSWMPDFYSQISTQVSSVVSMFKPLARWHASPLAR